MPDRVVLVARYTVKPGNVEAVLDALRRMAPIVGANEPGCTTYHVNRAQDQEIILGTVVPLLERREREFYTPAPR